MNAPNPAIATQEAARRLPRWWLLALCAIYVLAGFTGRSPWKSADMSAFGYMVELAQSATGWQAWLQPMLLGRPPEADGLLPYWLGALAIQGLTPLLSIELAARVPFALLHALALAATWWATYHLARSPAAQPLALAFGGEASPKAYARALADGAVLALLASLGLAQLGHETTPSVVQFAGAALWLYGAAAMPWSRRSARWAAAVGLGAMSLSGAPVIAVGLGVAAAVMALITWQALNRSAAHLEHEALSDQLGVTDSAFAEPWGAGVRHDRMLMRAQAAQADTLFWLAITIAAASVASLLGLWHWRIELPPDGGREWRSVGRLLVWFAWPIWPLALIALWRWRHRWLPLARARHLALPTALIALTHATALLTHGGDRSLLVGLPGLAALAALSLPTLRRGVASVIEWFTLLFFTFCAIVVWVVWLSMVTGVPAKPAANVARLAPGFVPVFEPVAFVVAGIVTGLWVALVVWRTRRHRPALWKTLVLPAAGAVASWTLVMTLWLPLLDFARGYEALVRRIRTVTGPDSACMEVHGLTRGHVAALRHHGGYQVQEARGDPTCPWLLVADAAQASAARAIDLTQWSLWGVFRRPSDNNDDLLVYRRAMTTAAP